MGNGYLKVTKNYTISLKKYTILFYIFNATILDLFLKDTICKFKALIFVFIKNQLLVHSNCNIYLFIIISLYFLCFFNLLFYFIDNAAKYVNFFMLLVRVYMFHLYALKYQIFYFVNYIYIQLIIMTILKVYCTMVDYKNNVIHADNFQN